MKILFLITKGDNIGGAQIYVRDLAIAFKKEGHQVWVAMGTKGALQVQLNAEGIETFYLENLVVPIHPFKDVKAFFETKKLLKKLKPDIVSINSSKCGIIGRLACYFTHTQNVFVVHGWSYTTGIPATKAFVFKCVEKLLRPYSSYWLCVSRFDFELGIKNSTLIKEHTRLIYNGIVNEAFQGAMKQPNAKPILVVTARHDHQKDHDTLFRALQQVNNIEVLLLGDGPLLEENKAKAAMLGIADKVKFLGYQTNVKSYLQQADMFALISNWEGFPLSTLEAMSWSLPVLISNVGGAAEAVEEGKTGFIIPNKNAAVLGQRLNTLIANPELRKELGCNGNKRYIANYTFETMFGETLAYFNYIITGSNKLNISSHSKAPVVKK